MERTRIILNAMRKRIFIVVVIALCSSVSGYALSSFFELSAGGGWSSLGYGLTTATQPGLHAVQKGSYGFNAHIGYGLQFTRHIGVGIGVDLARYGANARLDGQALWQEVVDTEGEAYNHITAVSGWSDRQELYMIEIPLALYLRFPVATDVRLYGAVGVKACIPLMKKASYSGMIRHEGFYEPWMLTIRDVPNHGFYTATMDGRYDLQTAKYTIGAFIKFGVEAPVDELRHVWLFGAVTASMQFMDAIKVSPASPIGWQNDTPAEEMRQAHYFMSDYSSILYTSLLSGRIWPIAVGAEIGVRFRIPHAKRYHSHCRCEEE